MLMFKIGDLVTRLQIDDGYGMGYWDEQSKKDVWKITWVASKDRYSIQCQRTRLFMVVKKHEIKKWNFKNIFNKIKREE